MFNLTYRAFILLSHTCISVLIFGASANSAENSAIKITKNIESSHQVFRFTTQSDTDSLDPADSYNSISSYLLNAIYTPLMRYQSAQGDLTVINKPRTATLAPMGAKNCYRIAPTAYQCKLRKDWRWSDGALVVAKQFVLNFEFLKSNHSPRLSHFLNIKNITAISENEIKFTLFKPDFDFLFRLIDPAIGPRRDFSLKAGKITYGPYRLSQKNPGRSFYLSSNPYFFRKDKNPPDVEIFIVDSDNTAYNLYATQKINFLRRFPTEKLENYKNSRELEFLPLHRFDYIGFGEQLVTNESLRKNLIYSLKNEYLAYLKLFNSISPAGCFSFQSNLTNKPLCFDDPKMNSQFQFLPYSDAELKNLPKLQLRYTAQGGDDISRGMQLFKEGWRKNLNINVDLQITELGVLNQMLKDSPPILFRRGVSLERPTCLAGLEVFESTSPDNYIKIHDTKFDQTIKKMRSAKDRLTYDRLCNQGQIQLLSMHRIIPLGEMQYFMLNDRKYKGFRVNSLNQIDISELTSN
jgi:oligopeptide transport system substrate-binding protein